MDSGNSNPEVTPLSNGLQPNVAPGLGGMAANMAPNTNALPATPEATSPTMPEVAPLGSFEQLSNPETQTGPMLGTPAQQTPVLPVQQPIVVQSTTVTSDDSTTKAATPVAAADDDLIEKEWVDHAKKIISSTKDNPHEQARLVAELMRDYVRKRYGKEVGRAPDDF